MASPSPVLSAPPSSPRGDHRMAVFVAAVGVLAAIYLLPLPPPLARGGNLIPLTVEGKTCLGIMAFAVLLWVTETLPFAATSLLVVLLIPAFGIADFRDV